MINLIILITYMLGYSYFSKHNDYDKANALSLFVIATSLLRMMV